MKWNSITIGNLAVRGSVSIDPTRHKDESFELYSIPSFDCGTPEIVLGSEIGSAKKIVQHQDVMISRIVPHIRRAWVVGPSNGRRQIASGEWIVFRSEIVWPHYLRWVMVGDAFHNEFMRTVSGVGGSLLRARPSEVFKIKIPFPPIEEQKRIAAILDAANALRAKRRESIAQLDALLQSTFLDMFGDPVTNPMGWECMPFNKIGRFLSGSTPSKERTDYWGGLIPWVSPKDMKVTRINDAIDHVTNLAFEETNLKVVEPRSVLIVVRGMILAHSFPVAVNQVPVAINQDMKAIVPLTKVNVLFLLECISLLKRQILSEVSTAGHGTKRLDSEAMKKILVPLPPLSLQRRFASIVEAAERQKTRLRTHLDELNALFASFQSRAFNGEL